MKLGISYLRYKFLKRAIKIGLDTSSKAFTLKYNMEAFSIINGEVNQVRADVLNGALKVNADSRIYISKLGNDSSVELLNKLKKLSIQTKGILMTFDTCEGQWNVELELYISKKGLLACNFDTKTSPCCARVGYSLYSSLNSKLYSLSLSILFTECFY